MPQLAKPHEDASATGRKGRPGVPAIFVGLFALASVSALTAPVRAASLSRSVDVDATPSQVWSLNGPFCSISDWHPAVGSCTLDGNDPPTRTLVTRDGRTTFVEPQVARSDEAHVYAYTFKSSPFPVQHYIGTIRVVPGQGGGATVIWRGVYAPDPGREQEANDDFAAIYEAGLAAIQARFAN